MSFRRSDYEGGLMMTNDDANLTVVLTVDPQEKPELELYDPSGKRVG